MVIILYTSAQEGVIAACYDSLGYSYIPMNHRDAKDIVMIPTGGKDTQRRGATRVLLLHRPYRQHATGVGQQWPDCREVDVPAYWRGLHG